jgi:hypothetical protein
MNIIIETPAGVITGMPEDVPAEWTPEESTERVELEQLATQGGAYGLKTSDGEITVIPTQLLQQSIIRIKKNSVISKDKPSSNVISIGMK